MLLLVSAAGIFGYWRLFQGTSIDGLWWPQVLLGLSVGAFVGNVQYFAQLNRQKKAGRKNRSEWQDGELVAFSGEIRTGRTTLTAPISGTDAAIVEYTIGSSDEESGLQFKGFLMAPCTVRSERDELRLIGFPLLFHIPEAHYDDEASLLRASEHLLRTSFKQLPERPFALLSEFSKVLKDEDGVVKEEFARRPPQLLLDELERDTATEREEFDQRDDDDSEDDEEQPSSSVSASASDSRVRRFADYLSGLELAEQCVANGARITVTGTYRTSSGAIDIGSGMTNINHTLQPGSLADVLSNGFKKATAQTLFWACVLIAGTAAAFIYTGRPLPKLPF